MCSDTWRPDGLLYVEVYRESVEADGDLDI